MNPAADPAAATAAPPVQRPPRRKSVKGKPWTEQETASLIKAYEERWYAQKRGQLRARQWEEVAATVAAQCGTSFGPGGSAKSGTQCRHKMEKLRKRYRTERQRAHPGARWAMFRLMDLLERGPMPISALPPAAAGLVGKAEVEEGGSGESEETAADGEKEDDEDVEDDVDEEEEEEVAEEVPPREQEVVFGMSSNGKRMGGFFNLGFPFPGAATAPAQTQNNNTEAGNKRGPGVDDRGRVGEEGAGETTTAAAAAKEVEDEEEEAVEGEAEWRALAAVQLAEAMRRFEEGFLSMERRRVELMREFEKGWMEMEAKRAEMVYESHRCLLDLISRAFRPAAKRARRSQAVPAEM